MQVELPNVDAVQPYHPLLGVVEPFQQGDHGGLAAARLAHLYGMGTRENPDAIE